MNATVKLFWTLAGFCFVMCGVYIVWGLVDIHQGYIEWVGTLGLALVGVLSVFLAFYVSRTLAASPGELPEDRLDANIDDGEAEQGFFSPWSWWPIILAGSAALMFLALAIGVWVAFIAAAIGIIALVGWVYEYQRGYFGH
jgi:hypothetical protein